MVVKHDDSLVVQFSHFSVKEFLTAERLAEPIRDVSRYHIRLEAAHTILVRACLGILLQLDDRIDRDNIESFPLARYAAQYWATHARIENVSSRIKDGMECLFDADKPHFATWLWIYNEDRGGRSMRTMRPQKPEAAPLYYAAMLGFRDLAEHLIAEHPEHVNARGGWEVRPLHVAASAGHSDILSLLIEHGANMSGRGINGRTPLHRASEMGRLEAGQFLLNRGADIDHQDDNKSTALIFAAVFGHAEFARMLLERGAMIDNRGFLGWTPLHWAADRGRTEVVRLLLERGADAHVRDENGQTPSELGSQWGYHEIVELLSNCDASSVKK
jgi:ankyrin repeat protein